MVVCVCVWVHVCVREGCLPLLKVKINPTETRFGLESPPRKVARHFLLWTMDDVCVKVAVIVEGPGQSYPDLIVDFVTS